MLAYLKGTIKNIGAKSLLVQIGDLGYEVSVPAHLLIEKKIGEPVELFTYLNMDMRDGTQELFGLASYEDLSFFKRLIVISGVGPRSALAALSVARRADLEHTIARGDPSLLQKVAGIGKKTAERIIIELRDKLSVDPLQPASGDADLISALENLGYKAIDVRQVLPQIPKDIADSSARLKAALKLLSG